MAIHAFVLDLSSVEGGIELEYRLRIDLVNCLPNVEDTAYHTGRDK
jgi:hypothetical protein